MPLVKTERAIAALKSKDRTLTLMERKVIILADGSRSRHFICAVLGEQAAPTINDLIYRGYLELTLGTGSDETQLLHSQPQPQSCPLYPAKGYVMQEIARLHDAQSQAWVQALELCYSRHDVITLFLRALEHINQTHGSAMAQEIAQGILVRLPSGAYLEYFARFVSEQDWLNPGLGAASMPVHSVPPSQPPAAPGQHAA